MREQSFVPGILKTPLLSGCVRFARSELNCCLNHCDRYASTRGRFAWRRTSRPGAKAWVSQNPLVTSPDRCHQHLGSRTQLISKVLAMSFYQGDDGEFYGTFVESSGMPHATYLGHFFTD